MTQLTLFTPKHVESSRLTSTMKLKRVRPAGFDPCKGSRSPFQSLDHDAHVRTFERNLIDTACAAADAWLASRS